MIIKQYHYVGIVASIILLLGGLEARVKWMLILSIILFMIAFVLWVEDDIKKQKEMRRNDRKK